MTTNFHMLEGCFFEILLRVRFAFHLGRYLGPIRMATFIAK